MTSARTFSFPVWLGLYTLSGFLALSLEIVWFRTLSVTAKATAFTFGTLLAVYLGGLGLGSAIGSVIVGRVRDAAMTFLMVQAAVGVSAGALLIFLLSRLDAPAFAWLSQYLGQYETLDLRRVSADGPAQMLLLYFGIPTLLIGLPTTLMGVSFPLLQRVAQTDFSRLGQRVGTLMVGNILGSTLGAILTGWLGLRYLGTAGTIKAIVATSAVFGVVALVRNPGRSRTAAASIVAILACAGVAMSLPPASELWASLHGVESRRIVWAEDETGLSVIKLGQSLEGRAEVYVNGLGQSWFPYGDVHTALGAIPALMHPSPREAAVIGLGSGDTVFGLAGRPEIERITCIEIIRSQLDTLRRFDRIYGYPGLRTLISDRRIEHVTGDGRLYTMRSGRAFDIIEADALRPGSAYSGNLYSDRYFMLLRDRLKPGGLAVTWAPTARIRRTFLSVFPHVVRFEDILVGSRDPIALDLATVRARVADPRIRDYYASASVDIASLLDRYMGRPEIFEAGADRSSLDDINTDLDPRDEFTVPFLDRRR